MQPTALEGSLLEQSPATLITRGLEQYSQQARDHFKSVLKNAVVGVPTLAVGATGAIEFIQTPLRDMDVATIMLKIYCLTPGIMITGNAISSAGKTAGDLIGGHRLDRLQKKGNPSRLTQELFGLLPEEMREKIGSELGVKNDTAIVRQLFDKLRSQGMDVKVSHRIHDLLDNKSIAKEINFYDMDEVNSEWPDDNADWPKRWEDDDIAIVDEGVYAIQDDNLYMYHLEDSDEIMERLESHAKFEEDEIPFAICKTEIIATDGVIDPATVAGEYARYIGVKGASYLITLDTFADPDDLEFQRPKRIELKVRLNEKKFGEYPYGVPLQELPK